MLHTFGESSISLGSFTIGITHPGKNQQLELTRSSRGRIQINIKNAASLSSVRTGQIFRNASATRKAAGVLYFDEVLKRGLVGEGHPQLVVITIRFAVSHSGLPTRLVRSFRLRLLIFRI